MAHVAVPAVELRLELLPPDDEGIAWLDPSATWGLAVGLVEVHGPIPDPPVRGDG